jgi:hypothetical protein
MVYANVKDTSAGEEVDADQPCFGLAGLLESGVFWDLACGGIIFPQMLI